MRAFLCLFGDDTLGVVLYLVDSQSVVQIKISEPNTIANSPWSISMLSYTRLLVIVCRVSNCMMHASLQYFASSQIGHISCLSLKCQKTADCVSKYSRVMIFAAIEPPQYIVVLPTGGKRIDKHDQGFDDFVFGGFGRWSIGLGASPKSILQRNS